VQRAILGGRRLAGAGEVDRVRQLAPALLDPLAEHRGEHLGHQRGIDRLRRRQRLREQPLEFRGARRPLRGILGERRHHHAVERLRDVGDEVARRLDRRVPHLIEQHELVPRGEEAMHGQHLPEDDPQRVHVGALIDVVAERLLGRHVAELALERAGLGALARRRRLGDPEVDQLDVPGARDEHVLRADVAMDDAEQATAVVGERVRGLEAIGDAHRDPHRELGREAALEPRQRTEQRGERAPVHVLHHEEVGARGLAELLDVHHVRVDDLRAELRLLDEHPDEAGIAREVRVDHLDRDVPGEPRGARAAREKERRHPARLEARDDLVVADARPDVDHWVGTLARNRRAPRKRGCGAGAMCDLGVSGELGGRPGAKERSRMRERCRRTSSSAAIW
jgi:hypothetical protein